MRLLLLVAAATLAAQDFSDYKIEKFTAGYTYAEGPSWSRDGYLLFSDVPANRIWKVVPGAKPEVWRENTNGANGTAQDSKGNVWICETRGRRVIRIDKKGKVEVVAELVEGRKLNGPNDIVVRKDGHAYFTDPAFGTQMAARELDYYGVYHVNPRDQLEVVGRPKGRPNGIALSPNGRVLYVSNTDERSVYAYDLDARGAASNERVFAKGIAGVPGGLSVDEKGNVYVAAKGLVIYSPDGARLHTIEMAEPPRSTEWGDGDLMSLYVASYSTIYRIRLNVKGSVQY